MKPCNVFFFLLITITAIDLFPQQAGDLDLSFDNDGIALIDLGNFDDRSYSSVIQSDGKIIFGGTSSDENLGYISYMSLTMLNPDGSLDLGFSGDGKLTVPVSGNVENGEKVLLLNNKIIIAGYSEDGGYPIDFVMNRVNLDGSIDNSFGTNGKVVTDFSGNNSMDVAYAGIIVNDKILLAGASNESGSNNMFALARYNFDGSLDNSFGTGGKVTTDFGTERDIIKDIAIQSDGKIIAVGFTQPISFYWALARYNQDGTLDNAFGTNGKATKSWGGSYDRLDAIAMLPNNNFLVAGLAGNFTAIARYTSNGTLDITFGDAGKTEIPGVNPSIIVYGNKIFAASSLSGTNGLDFLITRLEYDGQLDNTFGNGGTLSTTISQNDDGAEDITIQPDGKILISGYSGFPGDYAAVRYLNDPLQPNVPFFIIDDLWNQGFINFSTLGDPAVTGVSAVVFPGSTPPGSLGDALFSSGVVNRYYDIAVTPQNAGSNTNYNASLRLYYTDDEAQGIDEGDLKLVRNSSNGWIYVGGTVNTTENYVEANNVNEFGIFAFADPDSITNVSSDENGLVNEFTLEQNYPNPFNPSTKIRFAIPSVGTSLMKFVQLKMFDVLGNEVATLVDENLPAGSYEVEFNVAQISNLSSGIYFYSIKAGEFSETKKMILLR